MPPSQPLLRHLVTGIPSPTTEEPRARWNSSKTTAPSSSSTSTTTSTVLQAVSGSVRERARAYEQRHAVVVDGQGQLVAPKTNPAASSNASININNNHVAKATINAGKGSSGDIIANRPFPATEDKENKPLHSLTAVQASPTKPRSVYDLPTFTSVAPSTRPLPYQVPIGTPLTPRNVKHLSNPAPTSPSTSRSGPPSRPGTVQAGAFKQNRERANSTPKPSEWVRPASPQKQMQTQPQVARELPQGLPKLATRSAEAEGERNVLPLPGSPVKAQRPVSTGLPTPGSPMKVQSSTSSPISPPDVRDAPNPSQKQPERLQEQQKAGPALQSQQERQSRPPINRAMTSAPSLQASRPVSYASFQQDQFHQATATEESFISPSPTLLADLVPARHSVQMERAHSAVEAKTIPLSAPAMNFPRSSMTRQGGRPRSMTLTPGDIERAFEEMIDTLNLPSTVAKKMLGLDLSVKTGMLRSGTTHPSSTASLGRSSGAASTFASTSTAFDNKSAINPRMAIPEFAGSKGGEKKSRPAMVRKMKSFINNSMKEIGPPGGPNTNGAAAASSSSELPDGFMLVHASSPSTSTNTSPTIGFASTSIQREGVFSTSSKSGAMDPSVSQSAAAQALMLKSKTLRTIDPIKDLKKLRVLLRNESLEWLSEWVRFGGYTGLMERLWEVLNVEWREEQHDDAVLMELLKCYRALLMTDCGRQCLASYSPAPFRPLMELLYSEKKPGDLGARQCIVEIIHGLFAVFPVHSIAVAKEEWQKPWSVREGFGKSPMEGSDSRESSLGKASTASGASPRLPMPDFSKGNGTGGPGSNKSSAGSESTAWESAGFNGQDMSFISESQRHGRSISTESSASSGGGAHDLVKSLLIGPPNGKEEAKHDFIQRTHVTRIYKLWVEEIISVLSDYFWIFCHSSNTYWRLQNLEEDKVEEPKVPGGMTGGVEYEAMEYCASHLRLLNQLLRSCANHEIAQAMHTDLFASGLEKVILTLRKCSTTYYPQIHLELARYIDLSLSCGYPLHAGIRKQIEPVQSLSKSLSAGTIARMQAEEQQRSSKAKPQQQQQKKQGHSRSRTEGQVAYRPV